MKYSIRELQKALKRKGFDPGPVDGLMGKQTRKAIVAFKVSIGYKARPYVGPLTWAALTKDRVDEVTKPGDNHPPWLRTGLSYLGVKEIKGIDHEPIVVQFSRFLRTPFLSDEMPWCSPYLCGAFEENQIKSTKSPAARSWLKWGVSLNGPAVGCVVVFWRVTKTGWQGHCALVVGRDADGNLMCLGGNQDNKVSIKPFAVDRVLGYRYPTGRDLPVTGFMNLPLIDSDGVVSVNEA